MIPAPLHRFFLAIAHAARHRWRLSRGVALEGVTMIARDLEGQVLLVRHSYGPEGWFFPGGGIGRGESARDAAIRELREETGCECDRVFEVGTIAEKISASPHTAHIFTCVTHDTPRPDRREVVEARFFPTHSLPEPLPASTTARLTFWQDPANAVRGGLEEGRDL